MTTPGGYVDWQHRASRRAVHWVFPDGCRDVLVLHPPSGPPVLRVTAFDPAPRRVVTDSGAEIHGFRLRPGAQIAPATLAGLAADPDRVKERLGNHLTGWGDTDDMLLALTRCGATAAGVARQSGVSLRSLQRQFRALGLPTPDFWRGLGRARRAAAALASDAPLVQIACDSGFADQAHMTRDMVRWFGTSPARLRACPEHLHLIAQPALGNWTGEQISTR